MVTVMANYVNQNSTYAFLFDGNDNVCYICYHFQDVRNLIVHDLDL